MARWLSCVEIVFVLVAALPHRVAASDAVVSSAVAAIAPTASGTAVSSADPAAAPAASASAGLAATSANESDETLYLDVEINDRSIGKVGEFIFRRGRLFARPDELRDLGLKVPMSRASATGGLVNLSDLPGVLWALDEKDQVVRLTVGDSALVPNLLQPMGRETAGGRRVIESGTGFTLNYDTVGTFSGGQKSGSGTIETRAFSPLGIVSSEWLGYAGASPGPAGSNTAIRLDSSYTYADVNTLRRYSVGDFINGGLSWTRPVHMEGLQAISDFSMRPDLVTFPMPSISGSTAVPSTVSVLADGNLAASSQVAPGPFEIPQLPVVEGAGTISMTVTNSLGQQVTLTQPFYASSTMLARGLQTFAAQAGLVRRNWGTVSNDYGKLAGEAIYRRGLSSHFTIEGSTEGTPGAFMAGAGGVVQVGNLGVANFAIAPSFASGHIGAQYSAGAQRIGRIFSLGASAIMADRNYRDVASDNGDGIPRKQLSAFTGLSMKRFGSGGLAYAAVNMDPSPTPIKQSVTPPQHSQIVSANYSIEIHHAYVYATEFRDLVNKGSSGLQVGLTIPLGRRNAITASVTSNGSAQIQVQQPAPMIGDWGYQAYLSVDGTTHVFAQGQHKTPIGLFTAGIDNDNGVTTLRLESEGAVSLVDGGVFPSNTIYDSFAVVDTGPMTHVHVLQENRDVGSTNSSGRLLVPDMRAFDLNQIEIAPTDIPPDVTVDTASRQVRPQDRSGVVLKFPIKFSHGALLQLVDEAGAAVPLGSTATLRATGAVVPVGYDGDAYVEDLSQHNQLAVEYPDGRRCSIAFDYAPVTGEIPSIGPLRCVEKKP